MTIDFTKAQQSYAEARNKRFALEKQVRDAESNAKFYGSNVFSKAKYSQYGGALEDAKKAEFFADCDFQFAAMQKIDECCHKMMGGFF